MLDICPKILAYESQFNAQAFNQPQPVEPTPPAVPAPTEIAIPQSQVPVQQDYYKPKEYDPSKVVDPLVKPEGKFLMLQKCPDSELDFSAYFKTFFLSNLQFVFFSKMCLN